MKLSGTMIVKAGGDPEGMAKSLRSLVPFVDEMCILCTVVGDQKSMDLHMAANAVCGDFDVPLRWEEWRDEEGNEGRGWIHSFAEARNRSQAMVTGDAWCWIDADTILVGGPQWRDEINRAWEAEGDARFGLMIVRYEYDFEDSGECSRTVDTRMVYRSGISEWRWPVHELCEISGGPWGAVDGTKAAFHLRHIKSKDDSKASTRRNLWILQHHMQQGRDMPARLWLCLGQTQMGLEQYDAALEAYRRFFQDEDQDPADKWRVLHGTGAILALKEHWDEALAVFGEMAAMHPQRKTPWIAIAQTLCDAGRYPEALAALGRIDQYGDVSEGPTENPFFAKTSPLHTKARCYAAMGDAEKAIEAYDELLVLRPDMEIAKEHRDILRKQQITVGLYKATKMVAEFAPEVWDLAPTDLDMVSEVARRRLPKRPKGKQAIMIWCGAGASGAWGPEDLEKGLGGSEEAVVYLSRELVQQGFHVEVYAQPHLGSSGVDSHGVAWCHYSGWEDKPGIFVQWRGTSRIAEATKASVRYVWLHDVVYDVAPYTDELKALVAGVFCLSEFHAKPFVEHGWEDKVLYTKNGLPPDVLEHKERVRFPHSFVYYSSPDRGLDKVLEVWRDIRYAIADATLDIYYGFTPFYRRQEAKHPHLKKLRIKIEGQLQDLQDVGVEYHGMVGHEELHRSMAESAFWLYPTAWPETSCITGMKCQALGCVPITSRFPDSGVPETVKYDLGPEPRDGSIYEDFDWLMAWKDRVIEVAKSKDWPFTREEMMEWARKTYSWRQVAKSWGSIFLAAVGLRGKGSSAGSRAKASSTAS